MKKTMDMKNKNDRILTGADYIQIMAMAAEQSVGLEQRCARYSRRARRYSCVLALGILALVWFSVDKTYVSIPKPVCSQVATTGEKSETMLCEGVYETLKNQ